MRILIICKGNSCRSQMANGFLQSFDRELEVFSAGTSALGRLNPDAVAYMAEVGIDISGHTSDPVALYLEKDWDYVVTVSDGARDQLPDFSGKVGQFLHYGFDEPSHTAPEMQPSEFRRVRQEI